MAFSAAFSTDQIRDAYRLLGVTPDADLRQARKARLNLVRRYHPDVYAGGKGRADRNLAEINAAFDLLRAHLMRKDAHAGQAQAARQRAAQAQAERVARQRRAEAEAKRAEAKRREAQTAADAARKQAEQEARAKRQSQARKSRASQAGTGAPIRLRLSRPTLSARQIAHAQRAEAGFSFARTVWTRRSFGKHVLSA